MSKPGKGQSVIFPKKLERLVLVREKVLLYILTGLFPLVEMAINI